MKKCSKCKEVKSLDEFGKKSKTRLQTYCKTCNSERCRNYYALNKEKQRKQIYESKKIRIGKIKEYIQNLKSTTPCADCKKFYPYYVMDFDHQYSKKFLISKSYSIGYNLDEIKNEIDKCEIVCANCHRCRTFKKMQE